jgi:hypothetical protein
MQFPIPWQQLVKLIDGVAFNHAGENVAQVCEGFDTVELASFDERRGDDPTFTAAVTSGEEMVLAPQCSRPDGAFDRCQPEPRLHL